MSVPVAFAGFHQFLCSDREAGDRRTFLTRESPLVSGLTDRYVSLALQRFAEAQQLFQLLLSSVN